MAGPKVDSGSIKQKTVWKPLFGLIFFILSVLALYLFVQSTYFAVKEIVVEGARTLKAQEVKRLSGIRLGSNIFVLNEAEVVSRLLLHPMISSVEVSRKLPSTVQVTITERQPLALLPDKVGFVVIDSQGRYLTRVGSLVELNLPVITGITLPAEVIPGEAIGNPVLEQFLTLLPQFSPTLIQEISEISLSREECLCIYTLSKVEIRAGRLEHLAGHLSTLEQIVNQELKRLNQQQVEYVDMSFNGPPVVKFKQSS